MIEVVGLSGVLAGLGAAETAIGHATSEGLEAAAQSIRQAWVHNIVDEGLVLTGNYRDSIRVEMDGSEAHVLTDVPYAPILEHGDSRQAAHPVAQRAFDETQNAAVDAVGERITRTIR